MDIAELLDGIDTAKPQRSGNYLRAGRYLNRITRVKMGKNRSNARFLAIEMKVLKVLSPDEPNHREGEEVTHMLMKDGKGADMFLGNLKSIGMQILGSFLEKTQGVTPTEQELEKELTEEFFGGVIGDDQDWADIMVIVSGTDVTTKSGNPFTRVTYEEVVTEEELKAMEA